jgi:molybdopterin molybdotransferase
LEVSPHCNEKNQINLKENQLIEVHRALEIILQQTANFGSEEVSLEESLGRVLRQDIRADRDMPPFDRVSMDGIAISSQKFQEGRKEFKIEGVQAAGSPRLSLESEDCCIEAMTGAVLPSYTDAVIPYELVKIEGGVARILSHEVRLMQNVHGQGLDRKKNDLLIESGRIISPAEIGIMATVGAHRIKVGRLPRVAVVSTGDELVPVEGHPLPYQIRMSNVYSLKGLLNPYGIRPDLHHLADDPDELKQKVGVLIDQYDVIIFSGAVSKGKFDYLPGILDDLEVSKLFHRVQQRPGKPFWFGTREQVTVFAFPGNPVSTYVSCMKYFLPWLRQGLGLVPVEEKHAVLDEDFEFKPALTYFLQVRLVNRKGTLYAIPEAGNGSGDLANLTLNDAFLELPADRAHFKKGEVFPYLRFRFII